MAVVRLHYEEPDVCVLKAMLCCHTGEGFLT
jgi:hypothetical protein